MNKLPELKEETLKKEWDNKIWRITMDCTDGSQFIVEAGAIIGVDLELPMPDITYPWENDPFPFKESRHPILTLKIDMQSITETRT